MNSYQLTCSQQFSNKTLEKCSEVPIGFELIDEERQLQQKVPQFKTVI
jgi:hypothetical protein